MPYTIDVARLVGTIGQGTGKTSCTMRRPMNLLFVCSRNQWRSPTAERHFSRTPGLHVRSAGTASSARRRIRASDLSWADLTLVMEHKHASQIRKRFGHDPGCSLHVLEIPDEFGFMDPELIELLEARVAALLEG